MRRVGLFAIVVLLALVPPLPASDFGDFHVIPVAGRTPGVAGSMWETEIVIHNFQSTPITVEMGLVESGLAETDNFFPVLVDGASSVTIEPGATRVFPDLLRNHRGRTTALGALLLGADQPFAVTARVYNVEPSGATIGQTVPPAHGFVNTAEQRAIIPGLVANTNFRSNIGFVAAAGAVEPLVIEVSLVGPGGASHGTRTFTIGAGAIAHLQMSSTAIGSTPFDIGTAILRIVSGTGDLTGYASIVDNRSNHAAFLTAGVPTSATTRARSLLAEQLAALGSETRAEK